MLETTTMLHCPICKQEVSKSSPDFPFCSERCRTIDLAKWASGDYKISSPILDPEVLENLGQRKPLETEDDDAGNRKR